MAQQPPAPPVWRTPWSIDAAAAPSAAPTAATAAATGLGSASGAGLGSPVGGAGRGSVVPCALNRFVGQGARPAAEYHDHDFDWHEHAAAVRHIVEAQEARGRALQQQRLERERQQGGQQEGGQQEGGQQGGADQQHQQQQGTQEEQGRHKGRMPQNRGAPSGTGHAGQRAAPRAPPAAATAATTQPTSTATQSAPAASLNAAYPAPTAAAAAASPASPAAASPASHAAAPPSGPAPSPAVAAYDHDSWEVFYRAHPSARFFKERRYLLLEFPQLLAAGAPLHVAEIGAGCGSSILPVLKANPEAWTTSSDISTTCLEQLQGAAAAEGIAPHRVRTFPADATDPAARHLFEGLGADLLLIMFTLSAVVPEQQLVMLQLAHAALAPGGRLLIRDHGLYDMVQLRIPPEQWVYANTYKRGDATIAHFFSTEALCDRARAAGFSVEECKYVTVANRNRKTGLELRRVFVHGVFVRPAEGA